MTQESQLRVQTVADILERERDSTIKEWLTRVNLVAELTNIPLSDANRTSHLPKLFDDLLYRLRRDGDAYPLISNSAAAHGSMRFVQGYSPAMLVEESRIFQVSAFNTLHLHQSELDQSDMLTDIMIIADEADRQLTEAMRSFMAAIV
jgi:hypothetical protein